MKKDAFSIKMEEQPDINLYFFERKILIKTLI